MDLGTASRTLLTKVKLLLRRRLLACMTISFSRLTPGIWWYDCLPVTVFVGISHDAPETVQNPSGFLSAGHFWRFK